MTDPRIDPPLRADEKATLLGLVQYHRDTLALKCAGLDADALAQRALPPSTMSLLGLVRHLAQVEKVWFDRAAGRDPHPFLYSTPDQPDLEFDGAVADSAVVDEAFGAWRAAIAITDADAVALDLDATFDLRGEQATVRWMLAHLLEEYARHNGHADLLREAIDGVTGE